MKINKILVISLFLLMLLTFGAVSASDKYSFDNSTVSNTLTTHDCIDNNEAISNGDDDVKINFENNCSLDKLGADCELNDINNYGKYPDSINLNCTIPDVIYKYYRFGFYDISLPSDANGIVTVYLDGNYLEVLKKPDFRYFTLEMDNLNEGNHTIEFKYTNDTFYNNVNKTYTFNLKAIEIIIDNEVIKDGYGGKGVNVRMPKDAKGKISIYKDGLFLTEFTTDKYRHYSIDDYPDDYEFEIYDYAYCEYDLSNFTFNEYEIEVKYYDDAKYNDANKKAKCNVTYLLDVLYFDEYIYADSYDDNIKIYLPDDFKSTPIVKIDGVAYTVKKDKEDPIFLLNINKLNLSPGNHTLTIFYKDSKYPSKTITATLTIKPYIKFRNKLQEYGIYYDDIFMKCGENEEIFLRLPKDAKGLLAAYISINDYINNVPYITAGFKDGFAKIPIEDLILGEYNIYVRYIGDDYVVEDINKSVMIQMKFSCPTTIMCRDNLYLTVNSVKSDERQLQVYFNHKYYGKIKLKAGYGKISLNKLPVGKGNLELQTDNNYICYGQDILILKSVKLTGGKNIRMYYNDGHKYTIKVYNPNTKKPVKGKYINFKIGNKTFKVKTNSKGIASLKLSLKPGKYTITATFRGINVVNKIVVKQILTLKKVNIKKSAKKLVLKATLKQGKKPLYNKKLTFNFNGTKYKIRTNKKGIATVIIKKSLLNKLKAGENVTCQVTYLKNTVKSTLKVKG